MNLIKNICTQRRVTEIIQHLEQYSEYTDDLHRELSCKLFALPHDLENSFYNFFFCMDWKYLYNTDKRLTLYDIYYKTGKKAFEKAYSPLKEMAVNGNIDNISKTYQDIIGNIKVGLTLAKVDKQDIAKGVYEFMQDFLNKLVNVDYETTDFVKPYLDSSGIKDRFMIDVYDKFVNAYKITSKFNTYVKSSLETDGISIANSCFLHILLRHYGPLKVFTYYHPNPLYSNKIKNGIGNPVPITAFDNGGGGIYVIPQDGIFMSTKFTGNKSFLCDDIIEIIEVVRHILPVLSTNIKPERSPNIIFYNSELYGVEFPKYIYRNTGKILVESFYPLNGKWQKQYGISQTDYDHIINKQDIPSSYNITKLSHISLNGI